MTKENEMTERKLEVCTFCRNTGTHGARWVLKIGNDRQLVHKPCGQKLADSAPEGVKVALFPSKELSDEFRAQRFWKQRFAEAESARTQHA